MIAIRNCRTFRPTVQAGFPNLISPFWLAVVAPAATPHDIINKLNDAFHQALAVPETRARLATLGAEIKIGSPQDLDKMLAPSGRGGPPWCKKPTSRWNDIMRLCAPRLFGEAILHWFKVLIEI